ncbi:hypothetical protein HTZ77_04850 [Nonomuraea sp. SMC257]|uniref:Uncharacterized protein n=1 Tax=Nonomuraea montanisoli TaxID=2741721 RepID=A0A7Y6M171_9ACTN|nr:hypothetical protein [Nonomuraea montanisoli]NUW30752.1 hypothetical protein [Nonomuraea montanisoli]
MGDLHPHDQNAPIIAAVERWQRDRVGVLEAAGIVLTTEGPFEALGMDPVHILRLEKPPLEIDVAIFRGGILDVTQVNRDDLSLDQKGAQVSSADELAAALDRIADC